LLANTSVLNLRRLGKGIVWFC